MSQRDLTRRSAGNTIVAAIAVFVALLIVGGGLLFLFRPKWPPAASPDAKPAAGGPLQLTEAELAPHRPIIAPANGYAASAACRSCHPQNHATWEDSYHHSMTRLATTDVVEADFDNVELTYEGRSYRLERRGDQFWSVMDDPDAEVGSPRNVIERPIVLVTGSHHMQIYWYATGVTRMLGLLPVHYLRAEKRWVPKEATLLTPPFVGFYSDTGRWNSRCVACHTTDARIRPVEGGGMDTQVSELGISCEACHGPAAAHVEFRKQQREGTDPIVNPATLSPQLSSQVCGVCHSFSSPLNLEEDRRELFYGFRFRPGEELRASRFVERFDEATAQHMRQFVADPKEYLAQRFWPDGMVAVAGREYNGLSQSACHERGELACLSCHTLHKREDDPRSLQEWANDQLKPGMDGDQACVQCHEPQKYQTAAHTHHGPESSGSRCYNCHMPHTTYGLLGAIRSHQISSPNAATDRKAGRPNACNLCHLDQPLAWTAARLQEWYQQELPELGEEDTRTAAGVVAVLTGDAQQRALVAWSMGWGPARLASGDDWMAPYLGTLLDDPYAAVRLIAYRSLGRLPGFEDLQYDYVGSPSDRVSASLRVQKAWSARRSPQADTGARPALLLAAPEQLDRQRFQELQRRRNNRPVNLVE